MGKSSSCFKLMICGGDAADTDDSLVTEVKDSNDKRGWSFSQKSAKHRVLGNAVIADAPSANKGSSECTSFNFQPLPERKVVEKDDTTKYSEEKPQLSSMESSHKNAVETELKEDFNPELKEDFNPPESAIILIQAAIRALLAQRELLQLKNVVKLQAAVRGHLVRQHAVGTLRCVQAIAKMQVVVRNRCAKQSCSESHLSDKDGKNDSSRTMGNQNNVTKSDVTDTYIEKLLSNRFARQLLESTPKNKPIHVKCDPSKADSAWQWLERWMSISSKDSTDYEKTSSPTEQSESKDSTSAFQFKTVIPSEVRIQTAESKPIVEDSLLPSMDKAIAYDAKNFTFQASFSAPSIGEHGLEQFLLEKTVSYDDKVASTETDSFKNEKLASDTNAPAEPKSLPQKPEIDGEQRRRSVKRFATDQLEAEGKKSGNGSRKVSNPAFIAAQSKFEELSSMANSSRTSSLSRRDTAVESHADTSSVGTDAAYKSRELSENPAPYLSRTGGPELSISSTLDSPDISEVGAVENEQNANDLVEGIGNLENTKNHDVEANIPGTIPASNQATSVLDGSEIVDGISGNRAQSFVAVDSEEPITKSEKNATDLQRDHTEGVQQEFRSLLETSPRSHITTPESQGTPSSQLSTKPKDSKTDKAGSITKSGTLSVGNKSPVNANDESGSRGSWEPVSKDQRSGKRRNSFGSVKPDHIDQEPTDNSNNHNSIPHFMQATESARAKINANNSPRSSPDVHERDVQVKKRHSLSGASGRQVSPCIQRSMSQALQGAKGNGAHPPQERKWLR